MAMGFESNSRCYMIPNPVLKYIALIETVVIVKVRFKGIKGKSLTKINSAKNKMVCYIRSG